MNVSKIDEQNKKFLDFVNYFDKARRAREKLTALKSSLSYLLSDVKKHFFHEEKLFEDNSYPEIVTQKASHKRFLNNILDMIKRVENGDKRVSHEMPFFLLGWLFDHVVKEDKKYGEYLNSKGVT